MWLETAIMRYVTCNVTGRLRAAADTSAPYIEHVRFPHDARAFEM